MRDNYPEYVKEVNEARKKAGRKELDYANVWPKKEVETPKVGTHSFSAGRAAAIAARREEDEEDAIWATRHEEETIHESSLADMYAEMEQLWASGPDPLTEAAQAA